MFNKTLASRDVKMLKSDKLLEPDIDSIGTVVQRPLNELINRLSNAQDALFFVRDRVDDKEFLEIISKKIIKDLRTAIDNFEKAEKEE